MPPFFSGHWLTPGQLSSARHFSRLGCGKIHRRVTAIRMNLDDAIDLSTYDAKTPAITQHFHKIFCGLAANFRNIDFSQDIHVD